MARPNIGRRQVRVRYLGGVAALLFAVGLSAWMVAGSDGFSPPWRLLLLPLYFGAFLLLVQARARV